MGPGLCAVRSSQHHSLELRESLLIQLLKCLPSRTPEKPRFRIAEINIRRSLSTIMRHAYALTTNPTSAAAGGCRSDMPRHGLPTDRQTGQRVSR